MAMPMPMPMPKPDLDINLVLAVYCIDFYCTVLYCTVFHRWIYCYDSLVYSDITQLTFCHNHIFRKYSKGGGRRRSLDVNDMAMMSVLISSLIL